MSNTDDVWEEKAQIHDNHSSTTWPRLLQYGKRKGASLSWAWMQTRTLDHGNYGSTSK
jgi:hypothetical protein